MPPQEYSTSTVSRSIGMVNRFLQPSSHHPQPNINQDSNVTINDQILIRINKDAENGDTSEPTPEGVHQDGTELSSVTLIQRRNVVSGGESRIWSLDQPKGNYESVEFGKLDTPAQNGFSWENCLFDKALESPWETVIFNDRMVKHEARAFVPGSQQTMPRTPNVMSLSILCESLYQMVLIR